MLDDVFRLPYELEYRHSADFSYDGAKNKLAELRLESSVDRHYDLVAPGDTELLHAYDNVESLGFSARQGRFLKISAAVDLESRLTIGCAGAILAYIARRKAAYQLPGDITEDDPFQVASVRMFRIESMMLAIQMSL